MVFKKLIYILFLSLVVQFLHAQAKNEKASQIIGEKVEFADITAALKTPESVTSLKLNRQALSQVPADLSKFINLTELDLSDNELSAFPQLNLNKLEILNLSGNNLTAIPEGICGLKNLKTLNLSGNKIASGSLGCLSGLERVYLNNNSLATIPSGVSDMKSLKALYLQSNELTKLPESLAKMPKLEALFVQLNKIEEEPTIFKETPIINYIFNPQAVNTRYLYKYFSSQPTYQIQSAGSAQSYSEDTPVMTGQTQAVSSLPLGKWERMGGYIAWRNSLAFSLQENEPLFDTELEVGFKNYAAGIYISLYDFGDDFNGAGAYFKKYFRPLSSRFRPYLKGGLGFHDENDLGFINVMVRGGVDLYVTRFTGINMETGLGAGNLFSIGIIYRLPLNTRR